MNKYYTTRIAFLNKEQYDALAQFLLKTMPEFGPGDVWQVEEHDEHGRAIDGYEVWIEPDLSTGKYAL